jgi:hypothetical protein
MGTTYKSHTLKPPIKDLEDMIGNEAFCMKLAQQINPAISWAGDDWISVKSDLSLGITDRNWHTVP